MKIVLEIYSEINGISITVSEYESIYLERALP